MVSAVSLRGVMCVGRKGPFQSLASSLPALFPNLWNVASIWALFIHSRVSAKESKAFFAACHSFLCVGESVVYRVRCARWSLVLAVLKFAKVFHLKDAA